MTTPRWEPLLREWSRGVLQRLDDEALEGVPPAARAAEWLGVPGASEAAVATLEARLGRALPASYRSFLRTTDGWWQPEHTIPRLYGTGEVDWFAARSPEALAAWTEGAAERPAVSDAEYDRYGEAQDPAHVRVQHLSACLEIGSAPGGDYLLLNPRVVAPDGEWECLFLASWLPGAQRDRSFADAMRRMHEEFLEDVAAADGTDEPEAG